jgi:ATP-dependent helicase/nuclease subunit A
MVGDIKQSIYRFRQADPTIFIGKFHEYKKSEKDKLILLNQNFRSRVEILDFVNDIFKNLMKEELGEINYNEDVFLNKGSDFLPRKDSVEFNIIEKKPEEEIEDELQELKTNEIEARFIAERVKKIVGEKTFDPKNNSWIDIGYKDIVILLRSASGWASVFEEVFYDEGIPFYSDITSSYFDTVEIKIMTNLLKLIDNIRQDIPLLSIMRSVIGKFTTDEIIKIRTETLSKEYYKAVFEYKDCFDDDLSYKIKEFLNKIYDWRTRARNTNLSRLIWEILVETDYYYFNGALPNGNIRQGNLKLLTDRAFDFEKEGYSDILDFIDYFERIKKSSGDMTTAKLLGENDNVVRLMTIHKSKGLEFPVVICAGLNKRFNLSDLRDEIILNKICGIAPKYINLEKYIFKETLPRYASKIQIRKENISEEMRILYVALTRAVDRLILVGTIDNFEKWWQKCNDDKANYYNISTKNNYLDWIGMIVSESDKYEVNKISINEFTEFENNVYTKPKDHLQKEFFEKYSIAEYEKIKTKYSFVYPYYEKKLLPDKVTVTDIKELNLRNEKSVRYKIPNLKEIPAYKGKKLGFTPAEIGTITHSVLQLIGLKIDMTKEYIKESVSLMVEKKQLTKEEAEVVEVDKIYAFYNSKLGRRMLVSTKIKREQPFIVKKRIEKLIEREKSKLFQEVLVQGIIDCYFYENGKIILIDYKTDRAFSNNRDSIIKHYAPQVLEYKEALEILTKTKVHETYLYLLNNSEEIKIE